MPVASPAFFQALSRCLSRQKMRNRSYSRPDPFALEKLVRRQTSASIVGSSSGRTPPLLPEYGDRMASLLPVRLLKFSEASVAAHKPHSPAMTAKPRPVARG